jgi:multicomponent Na+:H+ antiporter subunit F
MEEILVQLKPYLSTFFIILIGCCFACIIRAWLGRSIPDRMVAIDIMGTLAVGMTALFAVMQNKDFFIDVALAWIFLSFIGTLALAKYLAHKTLDE